MEPKFTKTYFPHAILTSAHGVAYIGRVSKSPPPAAWIEWRIAIRRCFLRDRHGKLTDYSLRQPLGAWYHTSDLRWSHYYSPSQKCLFRRQSDVSYQRLRPPSSRRPQLFAEFMASPADLPSDAVPATTNAVATGFINAVWTNVVRALPSRTPAMFLPPSLSRNVTILKKSLTPWESAVLLHNERLCTPAVLRSTSGALSFSVTARSLHGNQNFGWAVLRGHTLLWAGHGSVPTGKDKSDLTTAFLAGTYAAVYICRCLSSTGPYTSYSKSNIGTKAIGKTAHSPTLRRHTLSSHFDWLSAIRERLGSITLRNFRSNPDSNSPSIEDLLLCATTQLSTQLLNTTPPPVLSPAPSTTATVLIDNQVVNHNYRFHLRQAFHLPKLRQHLMNKHGWTSHEFDDVHWAAIHAAYRRRTVNQQLRTTKFMYGWLPIGRTRTRIDPTLSDKCPSCFGRFESSVHLVRCQAPARRVLRTCQLDTLRNFLHEWRTPPEVTTAILTGLHRLNRDPDPEVDPNLAGDNTLLRRAITVQNSLGWNQFVLGFIAEDFHHAAQSAPLSLLLADAVAPDPFALLLPVLHFTTTLRYKEPNQPWIPQTLLLIRRNNAQSRSFGPLN